MFPSEYLYVPVTSCEDAKPERQTRAGERRCPIDLSREKFTIMSVIFQCFCVVVILEAQTASSGRSRAETEKRKGI